MKKIIKWSALVLIVLVLISLVFSVKEQVKPQVSADALLRDALREMNEYKNYPRAIGLARQALAIDPRYTDVLTTLGHAYLLNGNPDSSKLYLEKALATKQNDPEALLLMVNLHSQAKDTTAILQHLGNYLHYYPNDRDKWLKQYMLLVEHGEYIKAEEIYRSYTSRFDPSLINDAAFGYWQDRATVQQKTGAAAAARSSYLKALSYHSGYIPAWQQLVRLNIGLGDYTSALEYNHALLAEDAGNRAYLLTGSAIYETLGNYTMAIAYARRAYELDTSAAAARNRLVELYLFLARSGTASAKLEYAQLILAIEPRHYQAWLYRVNALIGLKQYQMAEEAIGEALVYYPSDRAFMDKRTGILYDAGDYTTAAFWLERQPAPSDRRHAGLYEEVQLKIAMDFIKQQHWDSAAVAIRKGLSYNSNNTPLLEQLVNVYLSQGQQDKAMKVVDKLLVLEPGNETYLFKKAGLLEAHQPEAAAVITAALYYSHPGNHMYRAAYLDQLLGAEKSALAAADYGRTLMYYNKAALTGAPSRLHFLYALNAHAARGYTAQMLLLLDTALAMYPSDSLFMVRQSLAYQSALLYPEMLATSHQLLKMYASDTGLRQLYLDQLLVAGKYYAGRQLTDSAVSIFFTAYAFMPTDTFALMNLSAIYFAKAQYDSAIYYADKGLQLDSTNKYLLMKKTAAYEQLKQYEPAYLAAKRLARLEPSKSIAAYRDFLHGKTYLNQVGVSHLHSFYPASSVDASVTGIQYTRRFTRGSLGAKLNYGQRAAGTGMQAGLDAYYLHSKQYYSNLFVNGSSGPAFPKWQAGYSLFRNFKKGWEAEAGARFLDFDSVQTYTLMGGAGKYLGNAWLNLKVYYTYNTRKWGASYQFTARQYLNGKSDYLSAVIGVGNLPDDPALSYLFNDFNGFITKSAGLGFQKSFRYKTTVQAFFNYTDLHVTKARRIGQYDVYLTLLRNF